METKQQNVGNKMKHGDDQEAHVFCVHVYSCVIVSLNDYHICYNITHNTTNYVI